MKHHLHRVAFFFRYAWLFSLFINLTLLLSPLYMLQVYDRVLTARSVPTLVLLTLGVSLAYLAIAALEALRSRILVQAGLALDSVLAGPVLAQVFERAAQPGGPRHAGALRDVALLRHTLTGNSLFAFFDAPWSLAFLLLMFVFHWVLGAAALLGLTAMLALALTDERLTRPLLNQANGLTREAGQRIEAAVRNAELVQALGLRERVLDRWSRLQARVLAVQASASHRAGLISASSRGLRQWLQSAMLGLGAYLVVTENLSSGVMIAASMLLGKVTAPVDLAIAGWKGFVEARAAYSRLDALLATAGVPAAQVVLPAPAGALAAERVIFTATPGQPPILKGVSFAVEAGECLAIIGPSASGKSTLLRVLLGLWRAQSGCVRLDGADLADWPRAELGTYLGYLPQDGELFAGTVGENIARMGAAAADSAAVVAAARLAGAHEMVLRLPKGYDTEVGDGGVLLSGGQRQRIGLARALYGAPRLVLLDEPNAHLDTQGEQALVAALKAMKAQGTTLVFVTHRPSLLNCADKVLALDAGQVLGFGPRDEMLARLRLPRAVASLEAAA